MVHWVQRGPKTSAQATRGRYGGGTRPAEGGAGTGEDEEEHGEGGDDGDGGESPAFSLD